MTRFFFVTYCHAHEQWYVVERDDNGVIVGADATYRHTEADAQRATSALNQYCNDPYASGYPFVNDPELAELLRLEEEEDARLWQNEDG